MLLMSERMSGLYLMQSNIKCLLTDNLSFGRVFIDEGGKYTFWCYLEATGFFFRNLIFSISTQTENAMAK